MLLLVCPGNHPSLVYAIIDAKEGAAHDTLEVLQTLNRLLPNGIKESLTVHCVRERCIKRVGAFELAGLDPPRRDRLTGCTRSRSS
jgi:hypothetical protein